MLPTMLYIEAAIHRIRQYALTNGVSGLALSKRSAVAEGSVRNLHKPDWNPNLKTLRRLEACVPHDFMPLRVTIEPPAMPG